jgi:hypothetical protein
MIVDMRKYLRYVSGKLLPKDWAYPIVRGTLRGTRFILGAGAIAAINCEPFEPAEDFAEEIEAG